MRNRKTFRRNRKACTGGEAVIRRRSGLLAVLLAAVLVLSLAGCSASAGSPERAGASAGATGAETAGQSGTDRSREAGTEEDFSQDPEGTTEEEALEGGTGGTDLPSGADFAEDSSGNRTAARPGGGGSGQNGGKGDPAEKTAKGGAGLPAGEDAGEGSGQRRSGKPSKEGGAEDSAKRGKTGLSPKKEAEHALDIDEMIRRRLEAMPLEDKVSGLFIITPEALTGYGSVTEAGEATREALGNWPVAGLIYFSGNIEKRDQVSRMLANTREWGSLALDPADPGGEKKNSGDAAGKKDSAGKADGKDLLVIPPFMAVDEEGGIVSRVANSGIDVPNVGSMGAIGAAGDPEAAFEAASTIGGYLRELGFNLDFAPDADVLIDPGNETIGDRSFGTDPSLCAKMVGRYIDGLHKEGVASCVKHFPGLGDTETDTHTGGAWSSRSLEDYRGAEFLSFLGGIEAGTDMVMISHLSNSRLTGSDLPASLNRVVITDILREELGYEGVIITDSLQMGAVTERFDSAEAAVTALEAGADILLLPVDFSEARQGILNAVAEGRIREERIDESLCRILMARYRMSEEALR